MCAKQQNKTYGLYLSQICKSIELSLQDAMGKEAGCKWLLITGCCQLTEVSLDS